MSTELDRQSISGNRTRYVDTELKIQSCSVFIDRAPSVIELDFMMELGKLEDRADNVKLSSSSINVDWARSKLSSSTWFPYTYRARQRYRARFLTVCLSIKNGKNGKAIMASIIHTLFILFFLNLINLFFFLAHICCNIINNSLFVLQTLATSNSWLAEHLWIIFFWLGDANKLNKHGK